MSASPAKLFRCIAHRGASGSVMENSLAAFQRAIDLGASAIELDIYYHDGQLIVFHDEALDRCSDGEGRLLEKKWSELSALKLNNGEGIPLLQEVFRLIDGRVCLNIELKGSGAAEPLSRFCAEQVRQNWTWQNILFSSYDFEQLRLLKKILPLAQCAAIFDEIPTQGCLGYKDINLLGLHPSLECVNKALVKDAHERGLKVHVHTVNEYDDIAKMFALGVDGIFCNFPERCVSKFDQQQLLKFW